MLEEAEEEGDGERGELKTRLVNTELEAMAAEA
jgi:hypothetical protein